jgi:hypothetical protein
MDLLQIKNFIDLMGDQETLLLIEKEVEQDCY